MQKDEFLSFVKSMRSIYNQKFFIPDLESVNAWFDALKDVNITTLRAAFATWVKTSPEPPTISDLRALVNQGVRQSDGYDWSGSEYWVLTDLDGYFINDVITSAGEKAENVQKYFSRSENMEGTVTKKVDFANYVRKYRPLHQTAEKAIPIQGPIEIRG